MLKTTYQNGLQICPIGKQSSTLSTLPPVQVLPGCTVLAYAGNHAMRARLGSSCHAMSAAPVAGRGALREEDGEDKSDANCSEFFPSLSLSSFTLPLWHSTSSLTPVDASPRQSVTFRAPRGRHPTRALTPQTPGGGGEKMLSFVCVGVGGSGRSTKC